MYVKEHAFIFIIKGIRRVVMDNIRDSWFRDIGSIPIVDWKINFLNLLTNLKKNNYI